MKKMYCFFVLFIYAAASLSAQDFSMPLSFLTGIGPEINSHSRSGTAIGGSFMLSLDYDSKFALGQKTAFFYDLNTLRTVEILLFFRYYLPWLRWPSSRDGFFVQAEGGSALLMERGYHHYDEVFPHFSGGAAAGWRLNFLRNWYVEPVFRFGYPHIWGAGVNAGIRLQVTGNREKVTGNKEQVAIRNEELGVRNEQIEINNEQVLLEEAMQTEQEAQLTEEELPEMVEAAAPELPWRVLSFTNDMGVNEFILILHEDDGKQRIQIPSLIFRADHADYTGLSAAILDTNSNTLRSIAQMLNDNNEYHLIIEGHANPTTPQGAQREAEEPYLRQLSEERAQRTADELVRLGVDRERLTVTGMGSSMAIIPYNEYNNVWKNRRVEFILQGER